MNAKTKKWLTILGGILLGAFLAFEGGTELLNSRKLATEGQSVRGTITEAEQHKSRRLRIPSYYLTVEFKPAGEAEAWVERIEVSKATYQAAKDGGEVTVHYLADNPSVCAAGETVDLKYGNLLLGAGVIAITLFGGALYREGSEETKAAEAIEKNVQTLSLTKHEYATVDGKTFKHLDQGFYERGQGFLEARNFRWVGDVENLTLRSAHKGPRTFLRVFVHPGASTMAALYHFRAPWLVRLLGAKDAKVLDLETWFADGTFVCTGNAEMAGKLKSPPGVDELQMAAASSWESVVDAHEQRINLQLQRHPGVMPVAVKDLADVLRAQEELQRLKGQHRQETGITKDELEGIMGGKSETIDKVHVAYKERRDQQPTA
jgi:hypothetical protein